jgi:ketosteroid isomerase-like protein
MLTAGTAFAQDFKSQATAVAAQWDTVFNSGDATKLSKVYTKDAVILPAGGEQVTGPEGAEKLFGGFIGTVISGRSLPARVLLNVSASGRGSHIYGL